MQKIIQKFFQAQALSVRLIDHWIEYQIENKLKISFYIHTHTQLHFYAVISYYWLSYRINFRWKINQSNIISDNIPQ